MPRCSFGEHLNDACAGESLDYLHPLGLDVIMQSAYVKDITYDLESYIPRINEGVVILSVYILARCMLKTCE